MSPSESAARIALRRLFSRLAIRLLAMLSLVAIVRAQDCVAPESITARLKDHPRAEDYNDLGIWFANNQQYACAVPAFAASLNLDGDAPKVALMFGASLYMSGNAQDAIPPLQVAEQAEPYNVRIHVLLASAFEQLNQVTGAQEQWRAVLRIDPQSSIALDHLSTYLAADHDYSATIKLLEDPIIRGERTATQSLNLGVAYAATGNLDGAEAVLSDGLNTSPDSLPIANALADVLLQLSLRDEAVMVLDLAMELHPEDLNTQLHCQRIGIPSFRQHR